MPPPNTPEEGLPDREPGGDLGAPMPEARHLPRHLPRPVLQPGARPRPAGSSESSHAPHEDAASRPDVASPDPPSPPSHASPVQAASAPALLSLVPEILPLDYQSLAYPESVDETLQCPICKTAFHEPVTTKSCGHTFCTVCLEHAYEIQPICPIDRQPLKFPQDTHTTRVITHQLDRLAVVCPNPGCGRVTTRALLEAHYERYCGYTPVACPDPACKLRVRRCDAAAEKGCLHFDVQCLYCHRTVMVPELDTHHETSCVENKAECKLCRGAVVRHRMDAHIATQCPEADARCAWHAHGCPVRDKRSVVEAHEATPCVYQAIGRLVQDKAEDRKVIDGLRSRLAALEVLPRPPAALGALDGMGQPRPGAGSLWDSPEDFLLSQLASMETRFEEMRKNFTELDSRHSMMLLNETLPLKNQITELRSIVGVVNMHTTWLMNFHRQQRTAAAAGSAVLGVSREQNGSNSSRSSADDEPVYRNRIFRRLSEGRNEQAPRL
ncbi:putative ubiquitin fusion degradation protein [Thozetella sp. PMI_491]|nr:putative ubiquitin fusion degradation protein [Thozetella sp. PMI_491]